MKLLLVEDDTLLGESLKELLEREGYEVDWIADERDIKDVRSLSSYDLIILDLILNFRSGEDILAELRSEGLDVPVLVLTAKGSIDSKEVCFNLGADDYVTKPFNVKELLLRVKALLRRSTRARRLVLGDTEIDLDAMSVKVKGRPVRLSKTAWKLLELFVKNRGRVLPMNVILDRVWEDKPVGEEVVRAYVKELRKILPPGSLETVRGVGYRFG